jgi:hypothetical protein
MTNTAVMIAASERSRLLLENVSIAHSPENAATA